MRKKIIAIVIMLVLVMASAALIAVTRSQDATEEPTLELGFKYLSEGKYDEAIIVFEQLIEIDEANMEARIGLTKSYVAIDEVDLAVEALETIIEMEPEYEEAYELLVDIIITNEDLEINETLLEKVFEKTEDNRIKELLYEMNPIEVPVMSMAEGEYPLGTGIEFMSYEGLEIYYDLAGNSPETLYTEPLKLSPGEYKIAVAGKNDHGDMSEVAYYSLSIKGVDDPNHLGNLMNGGYVLSVESDLFVATEGKLIKVHEDGQLQVFFEEVWPTGLSYYNGWIYYYDATAVYKIKTDGTERTKVANAYDKSYVSDSRRYMQIYNSYLYFINPNKKIEKLNLETNVSQVVSNMDFVEITDNDEWGRTDIAKSFVVANDRIFYLSGTYGESNVKLMSMNLEGSDSRVEIDSICSPVYGYSTYVLDQDYIYYVQQNSKDKGYYLSAYNYVTQSNEMSVKVSEAIQGKTNVVGNINIENGVLYYTKNNYFKDPYYGERYKGQLFRFDLTNQTESLFDDGDLNYTWEMIFFSMPTQIVNDMLYFWKNNEPIRKDVENTIVLANWVSN